MIHTGLINYCMALESEVGEAEWGDWHIRKITGGMNNRVFRATQANDGDGEGAASDLAIKFTMRDARDRAGREFATLTLLERLGLRCGPHALYLERFEGQAERLPVVVQTWVAGQPISVEDLNREGWLKVVRHLQTVHAATPTRADGMGLALPRAVLTMTSAQEGIDAVRWQVAQLPLEEQPYELRELLRQVEGMDWPSWTEPRLCLCRADNNIRNFIKPQRAHEGWCSVDWEYSGWGDPAFELADLMTMPSYLNFDEVHWAWVLGLYVEGLPQGERAAFVLRWRVYRQLVTVWWVARLARLIYEQPRQKDQRLVPFDLDALDEYRERLGVYVERGWWVLHENVTGRDQNR